MTTIETNLNLHTMREAIDRLPDAITLRFVVVGDVISLRTSEDGVDRARARVTHDPGAGRVAFEVERVGDAPQLAVDLFERMLREISAV